MKFTFEEWKFIQHCIECAGRKFEKMMLDSTPSDKETSCYQIFKRQTEKERAEREVRKQKEADSSKYVGEIGKRISFQPTAIQCLTSWETMYGTTFLYKIIDTFGNVFTWKTSSSISENVSSITGTVKNHSVYNGVKQTELTRCRVAA